MKLVKHIRRRSVIIVILFTVFLYGAYHALSLRAFFLLASITIRGDGAIPSLISALDDEAEIVRGVTTSRLPQFGSEAIRPLIQTLNERDPLRREGAAICLGRMAIMRPEVAPVLRIEATLPLRQLMFDDSDSRVKVQAALALWRINGVAEDVVPALVSFSAKSHDIRVRETALRAFEEMGASATEATAVLLDCVDDPDPLIQTWSKTALRAVNPIEANRRRIP